MLIDADNANPKVIEALLGEVSRYGIASVKRAYGDWTTQQLGGWKTSLLDHSIQPMQQFANTKGKNATDSAMIIDAMDLLHMRGLDGFCIVPSDSDFTGLARRIRENGLLVVGFGEKKTPKAFVVACDRFVYTELLQPPEAKSAATTVASPEPPREVLDLIRNAIEAASDDTGWAPLSAVGSNIAKQSPDFDSRSYGHAKLSGLVKSLPKHFQVQDRPRPDGQSKVVFIRDRQSAA
ncbi:NYN domain-containing protein [Roseomonas sp. CAU 1739]|uniref:NYN domain-containing protein n=1 Tax=Roseomonas sp. CAU 1739 TaxID=3140364 RepID=UPI00325AE63A